MEKEEILDKVNDMHYKTEAINTFNSLLLDYLSDIREDKTKDLQVKIFFILRAINNYINLVTYQFKTIEELDADIQAVYDYLKKKG